jgi:hypothetical protein
MIRLLQETLEAQLAINDLMISHMTSLHLAYTALLLRPIRWACILPGVHFEDVVLDQLGNFLVGHA